MSRFTLLVTIFNIFMMIFGEFPTPMDICPPGWLAWQDACYILLPDRMNWWQAAKVCDRPGSSLVVPDSQDEQDFIWRKTKAWMGTFGVTSTNMLEVWIGCTDLDNNGILTCIGGKGEPVFTHWNNNKPHTQVDQDCIRMADKYNGKWGDRPCSENKYVVCEMRVSRRTYCMQDDANGRFTSLRLLNHGIKNLTATGVIGCGQACWAEPRCHSFNLWQSADEGKICQLNGASGKESNDNDFKHVENCYFYEL